MNDINWKVALKNFVENVKKEELEVLKKAINTKTLVPFVEGNQLRQAGANVVDSI